SEMHASLETQAIFSAILEEDSEKGREEREKAREAILRTRAKEFQNDSPGIEFGYRYRQSPISIPDGPELPQDDQGSYTPTTWPGSRAPHVWLNDGRSTLDLFGKGFTLLVFSARLTDTSSFTAAAKKVGIPLDVVTLDESRVSEVYERRLVLVRPDGHVGWRGDGVPADAVAVIEKVRGELSA
ncbi:MAG TPA: hypothetical protein VLD83_16510, partial [Candidatus Binatia bacterium]|nr:hypothetical protein [Candidatus Binatia bacterium]